MEYLSVFRHRQIGQGNYLVTEDYAGRHSCNAGVIVGAERILVVDTGFGMGGSIRKYIESFAGTGLPMFCMCTHGDMDCVGGIRQFDEAYLNERDRAMTASFRMEDRLAELERIAAGDGDLAAFGRVMAADNSKMPLRNMRQRDHHHLGGVHVEVFELPGVTKGSAVIRITREGVARTSFVGDALNYERVNGLTGAARRAYIGKLRELAALMNEEDEPLYGTHSAEPMVREDILALAERLEKEVI